MAINGSANRYCGFCLIFEGGWVKLKRFLVNVRSTKSQYSEHFNRKRLPKDYDIPSYTNDAIQNQCNSFAMGARVTLFVLNNQEFNVKVGVT